MFKTSYLSSAALIAFIAVGISGGAGAQDNVIPNFANMNFGWQLAGGIDFRPVPGKQAPISYDPAYPQVGQGNQRGVMERMSDAENPNLKAWAKDVMRKFNQDVLDGHRAFTAQARCWPGSTPGQLLVPAEPIFFVQTPKEVWMMWQRDANVRRIYLNQPHSRNPKPSWFGESVGHYENGELVIDTISFSEHMFSFVDNWRTPHTKDLHVVERWKVINDGKGLEASVMVEDPGTFNQPWYGTTRYTKIERGPMIESICAENNLIYEQYFHLKEYPIPEAKKADF